MRVQHNIMAMGAYRNYTNNVAAMKKNLERLSSGYKINRAGDDAAGLAISEKMRAQITGLETAQKNAKDGISLVQTAEGALTEVHDMLNRMVELATQSANGTYDGTDRVQLQKEVDQLVEEINRIAESANFNGITLFDGSLASVKGGTIEAVYQKVTGDTIPGELLDIIGSLGVKDSGNLATNVVERTQVGEGMVLKQGGDARGTEFTVQLQNYQIIGANEGDTLDISIGDTSIKLTVVDDEDAAAGTWTEVLDEDGNGTGEYTFNVTADDLASPEGIAKAIEDAFNTENTLDADNPYLTIGGQKFNVEASGNSVSFVQAVDPTKEEELVDPDLTVKLTYTPGEAPPAGTVPALDTTGATFTITQNTSTPSLATQAKYEIDLNGFVAGLNLGSGATTTVTFSIGGKDIDIDVADTDADADVAKKLALALDGQLSDENGGTYVVGLENGTGGTATKITLTATNTGRVAEDLASSFSIRNKSYDDLGNTPKVTVSVDQAYNQNTDNGIYSLDFSALAATDWTASGSGRLTLTFGGDTLDFDYEEGDTIADILKNFADSNSTVTIGGVTFDVALDDEDDPTKITITSQSNTASFTDPFTDGDVSITDPYASTASPTATGSAGSYKVGGGDEFTFSLTGIGFDNTDDLTGDGSTTSLDLAKENGATLQFTIGEKTFDVELTADEVTAFNGGSNSVTYNGKAYTSFEDLVAAKLADQINKDGLTANTVTGATWNASATGGSITLTKSVENADEGDVDLSTDGFSVKAIVDTVDREDGVDTGTYNVSTADNVRGRFQADNELASTTLLLDDTIVADGNQLTIGENTYVFANGKDSEYYGDGATYTDAEGNVCTVISIGDLEPNEDAIEKAGRLLSQAENSAFELSYDEGTGKLHIHELTTQEVYDEELRENDTFADLVFVKSSPIAGEEKDELVSEAVTKETSDKSLTLQIGDTHDSYNQLKVSISDMHANMMGVMTTDAFGNKVVEDGKSIADVRIDSQEGAQNAIEIIKAAINHVSDVRGTLGATQNRLDHTINNLSVMTENIQDAESTIRDTDIAEEMMAYTKNNILIQASQAMLAQANQVPQGVLQLLQ